MSYRLDFLAVGTEISRGIRKKKYYRGLIWRKPGFHTYIFRWGLSVWGPVSDPVTPVFESGILAFFHDFFFDRGKVI